MNRQELLELIKKYRQGNATPEEMAFVEQYYESFEKEQAPSSQLSEQEKNTIAGRILQKIDTEIAMKEATVVPMRKRSYRFKPIAIAASLILATAIGTVLTLRIKNTDNSAEFVSQVSDLIAPDKSKATITLANGNTVAVDSLSSLNQGEVKIIKSADGKIVYTNASPEMSGELVYNTLTNPRGSKVVNVTLSDGTRVWLNSESSLRYPVSFAGNETRQVEITGEAYFETAHLPSSFKVIANGMVIEDLGTEFNVNSYEMTRTTLIKGKVKIGDVLLKPGQQTLNDKLIGEVDLDEVTAWKNGLFSLNKTDIQTFMKEVSRWYDVDVVYEGAIPTGTISGEAQRTLSFSQMQKVLQLTDIKFRIEGRKLIITSAGP
ncbi:MAG TPA: FecR domain-containing protein [Chitinophagaceae bacterium]|nr:FecR domain-containing protein [Chitinophagaceae bacterium]